MQIIICEYFGFLARRFYMRKRGTSRKPVSVRPSVRHTCVLYRNGESIRCYTVPRVTQLLGG